MGLVTLCWSHEHLLREHVVNRRRLIIIGLVFVVAYALIGLLGVLLPPTVSTIERTEAGYGTDPACMAYEKKKGIPYEQRKEDCRIRLRTIDSFSPAALGGGYWKWRSGVDLFWRFTTEAIWHSAFVGGSVVVIPDDINCWINYANIVSLSISNCKWWRANGDLYFGVNYVTSFGPVVVGGRTFVRIRPGSSAGPFWE